MNIESDMSFDSAMSALDNVSSKAPAAAPEDREGSIVDDDEDEDNSVTDDAGEDAGDEVTDEDNVDADSSDADDEGEAGPDEATDDAEQKGDEAEQSKTAIEPPTFLDATEREAFKSLPQAAQEILARQSKLATADYSRKTQEIAEKRKVLDARIASAKAVLTEKQRRIEKWQKVDWADMATKLTPQEWNRNKALMEKEVGEYKAEQTALSRQEAADYRDHVVQESGLLKTLAPDLYGDSKEAAAKRKEIAEAAIKDGFDPERLKWMSAKEMTVYRDALAWRKYQAEKAKKPDITAKKNEKSKGRVINPTSRTNAPSGVKGVVNKQFNQKPTQANAMSLLNALDD